MDKLKMQTKNKVDINIETIGNLFPNTLTEAIKGYDIEGNAIVEKAIDFEVLKQELSKIIVDGKEERYQMNWPGKKEATLRANAPTNMTLRPCREESVNFDTTENLYIEGDNLEVLKLLRETYLNKVKMIYIDPPYNTGNDSFVYNDNFVMNNEEFSEVSGRYDEEGNINYDIRENNQSNGRFHTDWLNMIYPRLKLAKDLLTDDGIIFISIDDYEQANIKKICDEIFGVQNFINNRTFIWHITDGTNKGFIARAHEYVLAYAKNIRLLQPFVRPLDKGDESIKHLTNAPGPKNKISQIRFPKGLPYEGEDSIIEGIVGGEKEPIKVIGKMIFKNGFLAEDVILESSWRNKRQIETFFKGEPALDERGQQIVEVFFKNNGKPMYKKKLSYFSPKSVQTFKLTSFEKSLKEQLYFNNPKSIEMLKFFAGLFEDKNSIILDFFSGSATTAHAVMKLNAEDGGNRKFIMIQLPEVTDEKSEARKAGYENICEIGKERIRRAGKKILEENSDKAKDLDIGFRVLKLDSSNMKDVFYNPSDYDQNLLDKLESNIKEERSSEDLLFQVMLELGEMLSSDIEEININGKKVFNVGDGNIIACFDDDINEEVITNIAKMAPYYAVFRDSSLTSDSVAANFEQIFKTYSPNTIRKVL